MKGPWIKILGALLVAVTACVMIAPRLQATTAVQGKFTLPFEAKWGKVSLPAGDYALAINQYSSMARVVISQSGHYVGITLPEVFDYTENKSKSAEIVCIRHNGVTTVRALRLPQVGTYYFSMPKDLKVMAARQPQMIETVSLQLAGE